MEFKNTLDVELKKAISSIVDSVKFELIKVTEDDLIKMLNSATKVQKFEIALFSIMTAIGGSALVKAKQICLREAVFLPYTTIRNKPNYLLFSAIGNVLLEILDEENCEISKLYKEALCNEFLYKGASLRGVADNRKKFLIATRKAFDLKYGHKLSIRDIFGKDINLVTYSNNLSGEIDNPSRSYSEFVERAREDFGKRELAEKERKRVIAIYERIEYERVNKITTHNYTVSRTGWYKEYDILSKKEKDENENKEYKFSKFKEHNDLNAINEKYIMTKFTERPGNYVNEVSNDKLEKFEKDKKKE